MFLNGQSIDYNMEMSMEDKTQIKIQKLKEIEESAILLMESMEILNKLVTDQEESLYGIVDEIEHSICEVKRGKIDVDDANEYSYVHYYLYSIAIAIVGAFGTGVVYVCM